MPDSRYNTNCEPLLADVCARTPMGHKSAAIIKVRLLKAGRLWMERFILIGIFVVCSVIGGQPLHVMDEGFVDG
jgi:hypothetical protein